MACQGFKKKTLIRVLLIVIDDEAIKLTFKLDCTNGVRPIIDSNGIPINIHLILMHAVDIFLVEMTW